MGLVVFVAWHNGFCAVKTIKAFSGQTTMMIRGCQDNQDSLFFSVPHTDQELVGTTMISQGQLANIPLIHHFAEKSVKSHSLAPCLR